MGGPLDETELVSAKVKGQTSFDVVQLIATRLPFNDPYHASEQDRAQTERALMRTILSWLREHVTCSFARTTKTLFN
jgi:hypothetical protein